MRLIGLLINQIFLLKFMLVIIGIINIKYIPFSCYKQNYSTFFKLSKDERSRIVYYF